MNLNQITVTSSNVERSISFYEKLGLNLIVRSLPSYARFVCPDGNTTFSIHLDDEHLRSSGVWIYFECENLDARVDALKIEGIVFDEDPTDKPWLWREARLQDPDGHQLILYSAGENRINPPWRIQE